MKTSKKIAALASVILIGIVSVVSIRTLTFSSKQISVPAAERVEIDENSAIEHLSQGIRIKTVSYDNPSENDYDNLVRLRDYIDTQYPLIHVKLQRTIINKYSLLYEWKGTNPAEKPIILAAHMDVVPAIASEWQRDPFSGETTDGAIWGRGAIDDKGSLFSILEAVENLLASGYTPERTVYLGFGHDEEAGTMGGMTGARKIAEYLENAGVRAEFAIDEGLTIADEELSPVKGQKLAMVGIAEKGWVTLKITATGEGGHSSMPGKETAIELLTKAVVDLQENPMPSSVNSVMQSSFDYFGPEMPLPQKMAFANRWLFGNLVMSEMEQSNASAAMLHTTVAPTIIQGGTKEQTLPTSAFVIINFRIIQGETSQDVIDHVKSTFSDPRIKVEQFGTVIHEPSPVSSIESSSFQTIDRTIREVFPDVIVAPGLVAGRTDSLYYEGIANNVFRFAPYLFGPDELPQVHGSNERIEVASYLDMIQFYMQLIRNSTDE